MGKAKQRHDKQVEGSKRGGGNMELGLAKANVWDYTLTLLFYQIEP